MVYFYVRPTMAPWTPCRLSPVGRAAAFGCRGGRGGGQAFEQFARRFVVRVLRHQFAAEGLGQQGRGQALGGGLCGLQTGFEAVGEGEQGFDAADDFGLFVCGRDRKFKSTTLRQGNVDLANGPLGSVEHLANRSPSQRTK